MKRCIKLFESDKFFYIDSFSEGLAFVEIDDRVGFIDKSGKMVIPAIFELNVEDRSMIHMRYGFKNGVSAYVKNNRCGFINKYGETVIHNDYDSVSQFNDGLAAAQKDKKWGFINHSGKVVIPFIYDFVQPFSEGLTLVKNSSGKSFIDTTGKKIIDTDQYLVTGPFSEGVSTVTTGMELPPDIKRDDSLSEEECLLNYEREILSALDTHRLGLMDKSGNLLLPVKYKYLLYGEGLALVLTEDKQKMYIDKFGTPVLQPSYEHHGCFSEGLAWVKSNGLCGCIDKLGNEVIPLKYENDYIIFKEGFAAVKKDGKWGYIDKNNTLVLPFEYDYAHHVQEGCAVVRKDDVWMAFAIS